MQTWASDDGAALEKGPAVLPAGNGTVYQAVWCATARPAEDSESTPGSAIDQGIRNRTTVFMRGLRERIELRTNSGISWQWRRIVFTMKGSAIHQDTFNPGTSLVARETSEGMVRMFSQSQTVTDRVVDIVFRGTNQQDWSNHFIAPVDRTKVTVISDTSRVIQSGNNSGVFRMYKPYYRFNKNLVYQDEEVGDHTTAGMFSVTSKSGMGDCYVYDLFYPNGGTSSDTISVDIEASLFWSEK
uniref:Capsid protein n=1 Tax=unidentified TaxID=32644 RepID=A0A5J6K994_9ZZZZ|nr:hypothetical protein [unidentified]